MRPYPLKNFSTSLSLACGLRWPMKTRQPLIVNWPEWKARSGKQQSTSERDRCQRFLGGLRPSEPELTGPLHQQADPTRDKPIPVLAVALRSSTGRHKESICIDYRGYRVIQQGVPKLYCNAEQIRRPRRSRAPACITAAPQPPTNISKPHLPGENPVPH